MILFKCCFAFNNTYMIYTFICIPFLTVERYLPNTIFLHVFQEYSIIGNVTIIENIALYDVR